MSYVAKGEKEYDATGAPVPAAKIHKIRITLTSSNVKNLEKCMFPFKSQLGIEDLWPEDSLDGPDQPGKGQAAPCQGSRQTPYQSPQDYYP